MQIALFILCGCACVAFGESTYVGKQLIIIICPIIVADCRIETIQFSSQYLSHTVIAHSTFGNIIYSFYYFEVDSIHILRLAGTQRTKTYLLRVSRFHFKDCTNIPDIHTNI